MSRQAFSTVTARARWLLPLALLFSLPWLVAAAQPQVGSACDPSTACFDVNLYPTSALADIYIDGNLVAKQVNSARVTGAPGVLHTIEARNMQDPGAAGYGSLFNYPDLSSNVQTGAGFIWRVIFYPRRQYIRGTLYYECLPLGFQAGQSLACRPTIDGTQQPDVAPGATAQYVLDPGQHAVHTDLVGDAAQNWSTTARDDAPTIYVGSNSWQVASFQLKGQFLINVYPAGIVGDIYMDGNLLASQAASAQVYTTPGVAHTIEVRNVTDPAANGRYRYDDYSVQAYTYANSVRYVYARPNKVWLKGSLSVACIVSTAAPTDDVACQLSADGAPVGNIGANGRQSFDLPTGAHTIQVSLTGSAAGRWTGAVGANINIYGGSTSYYQAYFGLLPAAPTPQPVGPVAPGGATGGFELGGQVNGFSRPDLMAYAGMTWVKRQVRWSPGAQADAGEINDAHGKGFKILLSVLGSPDDISGGANYADYARYVGQLAADGADAIEVWNEMNLDREWPAGQIDPNAYTQLLKQAYTAIKAANPGTMVISGALSPTGAEGAFGLAHVWNDNHYLAGMAAAGAANYADCIGVHYNEGIISPTQNSGDPRGDNYYTRYYQQMVSTYYNAFGGARPLCFTELGYLTPEGYPPLPAAFGWAGNTTVAEQAQWLSQVYQLASSSGGVVRMVVIFNVDFTVYGDDPQAGYAMIRPGGSCPACDALHAVDGGR